MEIIINIQWDDEASVYIATCDEIGLALESESYDRLIGRVKDAVPELFELNGIKNCKRMIFLTNKRQMEYA